mmetsp:Transcript_23064/g.69090  ORF Transcript_23064/g.69090 Transcript_23064/m.69090 type:complete len:328 (-) Transcript_23064:1201-2184(-)
MRKRVASSMTLSKLAAAPFTSPAACSTYSGRACTGPRGAAALDCLQPGKRDELLSGAKSVLRNSALRCSLTAASSSKSLRSFCTCARSVTGGTKSSQSSRLSHMCGSKSALSMALSSSAKAEPERFFQNALPMNSAPPQLPSGSSDLASTAASRSNLSRLRSTPLGTPGAAPGTSRGISASPVRAWMRRWERFGARAMDTLAVGTRPTGTCVTRCSCPTPISTPPYTPCILLALFTPSAEDTIRPSSTWICDMRCSFQSWGISRCAEGPADMSAMLNHSSPRLTWFSTRNFANTEAFASSRRWKTTLFRSAMSSKLCVKASAYCTRG